VLSSVQYTILLQASQGETENLQLETEQFKKHAESRRWYLNTEADHIPDDHREYDIF